VECGLITGVHGAVGDKYRTNSILRLENMIHKGWGQLEVPHFP